MGSHATEIMAGTDDATTIPITRKTVKVNDWIVPQSAARRKLAATRARFKEKSVPKTGTRLLMLCRT
jgi:hypothetical protein